MLSAATAELRAGWTRTERQIQVAATIEKRDVIEDLLSPARFYHHAATTSRPDTIAGFRLPFHKSRAAGCPTSPANNSGPLRPPRSNIPVDAAPATVRHLACGSSRSSK